MNLKDPKTTIVAAVVGFIVLALVCALLIHRIDIASFGAATGTVGGMGATVLGYFASDSKGSPPIA